LYLATQYGVRGLNGADKMVNWLTDLANLKMICAIVIIWLALALMFVGIWTTGRTRGKG
jgi:hypothetical protein